MNKLIKQDIASAIEVFSSLLNNEKLIEDISRLADICLYSLQNGGKIIFAGNGGSFADSQHLCAEFVSRLKFDRLPLASIALGTNSSSMSAIGNDYGYDQVFAREIAVLANKEDVFIPITTSGNSPNILEAVKVALDKKVKVVGLTGGNGGGLVKLCDSILIPSNRTERIQEGHILTGHIICGLVESKYFNIK
jgi:D-sedoheptulose 7-phosphate isomerase